MELTKREIARMIDLSGVRAYSGEGEVRALVRLARKYQCGVVTVLPSQTPLAIDLLRETPAIRTSGNVGFPAGGNTTNSKVFEARELAGMVSRPRSIPRSKSCGIAIMKRRCSQKSIR